jgi:hypothetical protein
LLNIILGTRSGTPSKLQVLLHEQLKPMLLAKFDADDEAYFYWSRYVKTDHPVAGWGQKADRIDPVKSARFLEVIEADDNAD